MGAAKSGGGNGDGVEEENDGHLGQKVMCAALKGTPGVPSAGRSKMGGAHPQTPLGHRSWQITTSTRAIILPHTGTLRSQSEGPPEANNDAPVHFHAGCCLLSLSFSF